MRVSIVVPIYQRRVDSWLHWTTLTLDEERLEVAGRSAAKMQRRMIRQLRKHFEKLKQADIELWRLPHGLELRRVRMDLVLKGAEGRKRVHGKFP